MGSALNVLRHPAPKEPGLCAGRHDFAVCAPEPHIADALHQSSPLCRIYTSPASRCRAWAQQLADRFAIPLHIDARLQELHFGQWEGMSWAYIHAHDSQRFTRWADHWLTASPPGGESLPALEQRLRSFLRALGDQPALVVTHAGPIRAMLVIRRNITWPDAMSTPVPYATLMDIK